MQQTLGKGYIYHNFLAPSLGAALEAFVGGAANALGAVFAPSLRW